MSMVASLFRKRHRGRLAWRCVPFHVEALETRRLLAAPPVALPDMYMSDGSTLNIPAQGVLANDSDADFDPLTAVLVNDVARGDVTLNADGSFSYTPEFGFAGTDSFTYRAVTLNPSTQFNIDPAQSSVTVDAHLHTALGSRRSVDSSSLTGTITKRVTPNTATFSEVHITQLDATIVDGLDLVFDYGFFVGKLSATAPPDPSPDPNLEPLRIQMVRPGNAAMVSAGSFNQTNNELRMDGIVDLTATGIFSGLVTSGPMPLNLSGLITDLAGSVSQNGQTVTLSVPINFSDTFDLGSGNTLDVTVSGTAVATGPVVDFTEQSAETTVSINVAPQVLSRHVFYNNSAFDNPASGGRDDDAIATDKRPLFPGNRATFENYTSYSRGINGVIVDLAVASLDVTEDDFEFRTGNSENLAQWVDTPPASVSVSQNVGVAGSDRVTIIWPDDEIQDEWLQVTIKPTVDTGLTHADVFYFGNAMGESGDSPAHALVNAFDRAGPRDNAGSATIVNRFDYDRDGNADGADISIARDNGTDIASDLELILAMPAPPPALPLSLDMVETDGEQETVFPVPQTLPPQPSARTVDLVMDEIETTATRATTSGKNSIPTALAIDILTLDQLG